MVAGNGHTPLLYRMLKLSMASFHGNEDPSIPFYETDDFSDLHSRDFSIILTPGSSDFKNPHRYRRAYSFIAPFLHCSILQPFIGNGCFYWDGFFRVNVPGRSPSIFDHHHSAQCHHPPKPSRVFVRERSWAYPACNWDSPAGRNSAFHIAISFYRDSSGQ